MRIGLTLALIAVSACGGGGSSGPTPGTPTQPSTPSNPVSTTTITIQGSAFDPSNIQVAPGATVTFNNTDNLQHNVTFAGQAVAPIAAWTSGNRSAVMPTAAGTYNFQCTLHGGMSGSVKVQ
jgi:plastocyanin